MRLAGLMSASSSDDPVESAVRAAAITAADRSEPAGRERDLLDRKVLAQERLEPTWRPGVQMVHFSAPVDAHEWSTRRPGNADERFVRHGDKCATAVGEQRRNPSECLVRTVEMLQHL